MSPIKRPSYLRIDALKELGNIGSAHAITGLSELLKKRIDVSITNVDIIPLQIIYTLFNGPESMVSVVYLEGYSEDFRGMMFLIFPHPEAQKMVEMATGSKVKELVVSDEMALSSLKEIGNIMCGCYLNTLAMFIGRRIMHSVPQISNDMLGAVMDSILVDLSLESDYAIVLETAFSLTQNECKGFLFFIPTSESIDTIFNAINVE
ncbi:MAG: chemotaxis protein CheC [Candidatus Dadabacteria bacterium]|jgi:chemotaxis protein CheC|nr:chemotaxis protein CheC [Candidatus Dadabacteria bacterium]